MHIPEVSYHHRRRVLVLHSFGHRSSVSGNEEARNGSATQLARGMGGDVTLQSVLGRSRSACGVARRLPVTTSPEWAPASVDD